MNLPNGNVTFLFSDIENSTRLWEEHPGSMPDALARHDTLLRQIIEAREGRVFKTMGDAVYAVFSEANDAARAALDSQAALLSEDWGEIGAMRVRMALHTGRADERDGDYLGPSLNRVARLLAIGHGGQILVSEATHAAIEGAELRDASLRDLGSHRLKGLSAPERVYQLTNPGLAQEFPPLRSLSFLRHNLPVQVTSLVGREREIEEVKRRLGEGRLLTLTGSGGVGKTRLALQVAEEVVEEYPDGVWVAELAALSEPDLVAPVVAQAIGVREKPGAPIVDALTETLRDQRLLLALDNCEHLIDACARLADTLLRSCPDVKILATSREVLGIAGEAVYRVPSLSMPESVEAVTPDALGQYESVRLFVERAATVAPAFAMTPGTAVAVARVCQQLDGIPLAIELAAARVRALSVEQVAQRLDDRFRLLTGGSRTAFKRQQTLRALIDWSYDLLSQSERTLLARLSVFVGGWMLAAAEEVCAGGDIEAWEMLDLLSGLVNKSLVVYEGHGGTGRYRLSETIRQYARERLAEGGEVDTIGTRHRDHYLGLVEALDSEVDFQSYVAVCEAERDNLRAALSFSMEEPEGGPDALRLAVALWPFWRDLGDYGEGRGWLQAALEKVGDSRSRERMVALYGAAYLAMQQSDYAVAQSLAEECLELARERGEEEWREHPLIVLGHVTRDPARARQYTEERIAILRTTSRLDLPAEALADLGQSLLAQGETEAARGYVEEALAAANRSGVISTIEYAKARMALMARIGGDYPRAKALYEEHLARSRAQGDLLGAAFSLRDLGVVEMFLCDREAARADLVEATRLFQRLGNKLGLIRCLEGMAQLASVQGAAGRAARLFAAAEQLRESFNLPLPPVDRGDYNSVALLRIALGEALYESAAAEGRRMTLDQAVGLALAG